jgi:predicted transcriptional regulator
MHLTAPELEIHKILWQHQPQTGKAIHERLHALYAWSYSSTRKTLERMVTKGALSCDTQGNKKIYTSELEKIPTLAVYAQDFASRVLEIRGPVPVAMFSDSQLLKEGEIDELEAMLHQLYKDKTKDN